VCSNGLRRGYILSRTLLGNAHQENQKKRSPIGSIFQYKIAAVVALIYWHWHQPAPNKAVLLLAAVASLMVLADMRPLHKTIYFVIIVGLVVTESRAIDKDRADFVRDEASRRKEENQKFSEIGTSITTNVGKLLENSDQEFAKTMARSDVIISGVADSIKTQTGGNSFAFITFTAQAGYVHFEEKESICQQISGSAERDPARPYFQVAITSHGKFPLRELHATMMDDERRLAAMVEYNDHPGNDWIKAISSSETEYRCLYLKPQSPEGPSGDVEMLGTYPLPKGGSKRLSIAFRSPNGYWDETLHLGLVNGQWRQCLSVMGPTAEQAMRPFIHCEPEWAEGRALAEKDWATLKSKVKKQGQ
jgi:hypothetical protein